MQRQHDASILSFFVWVFVLCIPFWGLGATNSIQLLPGLPLSALGAFVPGLVAIILTYRSNRLAGVLELLKRSFDFKRLPNWYWLPVILLINPAIAICAYGVLGLSGKPLPT